MSLSSSNDGLPDYDATVENWLQKEPASDWLEQFLKLDLSPGNRLLDCGCGAGKYAQKLIEAGLAVVGIDQSLSALRLARENNEGRLPVANAKIGALPLRRGAFDFAFMRYVLHHFDKGDYISSFEQIRSVLAENGAIIIETAFHADISSHFDHKLFPALGEIALGMYPDRKEVVDTLRSAGFELEKEIPIVRKQGQFTTVAAALENSQRLVERGRGPTTWLRLSEAQRGEFHDTRKIELPRRFRGGRVPREWKGTLLLARKR